MFQQPDYYETRRSNKAQEMNQILSVMAGLAQQKMQNQQSQQNSLINAGYIPNQEQKAPNAFQKFLGMGGGQNVPSPDQSQIDPNAPPQIAGYSYVGKPVYQMGVDAAGNPTMINMGNVGKNAIVKGAQSQKPSYGDYTIDASTPEGKMAFVESIPANMRAAVTAIADGSGNIKDLVNIRSGDRAAIFNAVKTINPDFDQSDFNVKQKFAIDFTSGKSANNIKSLNTAIGHLETLNDLMVASQNGDVQSVNRVINFAKEQTGNPNITSMKAAIEAIKGEAANAFKQSGATNQEIEAWDGVFKKELSPAQWTSVSKTVTDLLASRAGAYSGIYKKAMKKDMTPDTIFTEKSLNAMKKFGIDPQSAISGKSSSDDSSVLKKLGLDSSKYEIVR
jgi:hypothetical protein